MDELRSIVLSKFFVSHVAVILSYAWTRQGHPSIARSTGRNPFSSSFAAESQVLLAIVMVAVSRIMKSDSWRERVQSLVSLLRLAVCALTLAISYKIGAIYIAVFAALFFLVPPPKYQGPSQVHSLTAEDLDSLLKTSKNDTALCLYATWHPDCDKFEETFAKVSQKLGSEALTLAKFDVGHNPPYAKRFQVDISATSRSLPTILFLRQGQEVRRTAGALPRKALEHFLLADNDRDEDDEKTD
ncbi:MAG: hypothetical protein MHM6MM_005459 [Cercozoa sp. M6MM]